MNQINAITYCMNVHQDETLPGLTSAITGTAVQVKNLCSPNKPMPLGLRIGRTALNELTNSESLRKFAELLNGNNFVVMGINGFPYGSFHNQTVKERVYTPDWCDVRRIEYTRDLFFALNAMPSGEYGDNKMNVTTVPIAYGKNLTKSQFHLCLGRICAITTFLRKLEGFTGHRMRLALEPEPDCFLDSLDSILSFFEQFQRHPDFSPALMDYLGVCFDTCHFAVGYEDPLNALRRLVAEKIPIARIQISAALEADSVTQETDLLPFVDSTYLHQTRMRTEEAQTVAFPDLTADVCKKIAGQSARIHFHVPLTWNGGNGLHSTRHTLTETFWRFVRAGNWPIEVETYTYHVLPEKMRERPLAQMIADDILWVEKQLRTS